MIGARVSLFREPEIHLQDLCDERRTFLQLIVILLCAVIAISDGSLDRFSRLAHHALNLLGGSWSSFAHIIGIRYDLLLALCLIFLADVGIGLEFTTLLDERGQIFDCSRPRVGDWIILGASWEQFDGGEPLDLIRHIVGGSVDLRDSDLLVEIRIGSIK